jgi:hypothetical protein
MELSVKCLLVIGLLLVGASGKFINGPWVINRLNYFHYHEYHETVKVNPPNGLSPVIFGEILFLHKLKVQVTLSLTHRLYLHSSR